MSDDDPTTASASEGTDRPATGRRRRAEPTGHGQDPNTTTGSLPTLVLPTLVPPPRPPRMADEPVLRLPDPTWAEPTPTPGDTGYDRGRVPGGPAVPSASEVDADDAATVDPSIGVDVPGRPPAADVEDVEVLPVAHPAGPGDDLVPPLDDPAAPTVDDHVAPTVDDETAPAVADEPAPTVDEDIDERVGVEVASSAPAPVDESPAVTVPTDAPVVGGPAAVTTPEVAPEPTPVIRETWEGRDVSTEQPRDAVSGTGRHQVAPEVEASFEDTLPGFARIPSTPEPAATEPAVTQPPPPEPPAEEAARHGAVAPEATQRADHFPLLTHGSVDDPAASSGPIADRTPEPRRRTDGLGRELQDPPVAPRETRPAAPAQPAPEQPWSSTQQPWSATQQPWSADLPPAAPPAGAPHPWPAAPTTPPAQAAPPWPTRAAPPSGPQQSWPVGQDVGGAPQPQPWPSPAAPPAQPWPNGHQPPPPADEQSRAASPRLTDFLAQQAPPPELPATWGMRGVLSRMGMRMAPTSAELAHRHALSTIQRSLGGPKTIVVVNQKGGAGKTPATFLLAAVIGRVRGGFTLAWDNNENAGTLGWKGVGQERAATVVDLLGELERFTHPELGRVGDLDNFVRSQGDDRFDLLASNQSTDHGTSQIGSDDFHAIHDAMSRYYRVLVVDTGNNDLAPNWQAALDAADQIVVPIRLGLDYAGGASRTLDVLDDIGHGDLVKGAVAIVSQSTDADKPDVRAHVRDHFGPRVRSIVDVPFDPALVEGRIVYDALRPGTRNAWIRAAAAVVSGL